MNQNLAINHESKPTPPRHYYEDDPPTLNGRPWLLLAVLAGGAVWGAAIALALRWLGW